MDKCILRKLLVPFLFLFSVVITHRATAQNVRFGGHFTMHYVTFRTFDKSDPEQGVRWGSYYNKASHHFMNGDKGDFTHEYPSDFLAVVDPNGNRIGVRIHERYFEIAPDNQFSATVTKSVSFQYKGWDGKVYEVTLQNFLR